MSVNTKIITLEGYDEVSRLLIKLSKEKEHWVEEKRIAAEQGDRSENAEYTGAKENIRVLDRQLYKLNYIIQNTKAVNTNVKKNENIILFGCNVEVLRTKGDLEETLTLKIVGTHEGIYLQKLNKNITYISTISPLGLDLMRKEVGDEVEFKEYIYEVIKIF